MNNQGFLVVGVLMLMMQPLAAQNKEGQQEDCEKRAAWFKKATVMDGDVIQWWQNPPMVKGGAKAIAKAIQYPDSALQAGIEGKVFIELFLSKDNRPECVKILLSNHKVFTEEALQVITRLEYEPATKLGKPIYNVMFVVIVDFDKEAYLKNQKKKRKK